MTFAALSGIAEQALIDTATEGLGTEFTAEARDAWLAAYSLLSP
jgi:hemoglobin-like flavoprotein